MVKCVLRAFLGIWAVCVWVVKSIFTYFKVIITERNPEEFFSGKFCFRVFVNFETICSVFDKVIEFVKKPFVHVLKVNTMNRFGKWRRVRYQPGMTADVKKAIVTLKKGEKIDIAL